MELTEKRIHAFISYANEDRNIAEQLSKLIESNGYIVWWDSALLAGENFRSQIAQKLQVANVVFAIFSEKSVESGWVLDEAGRAAAEKKLVPIVVDNIAVPLGFGQIQCCELIDWQQGASEKFNESVIKAIEQFTGINRKVRDSVIPYHSQEINTSTTFEFSDRFKVRWTPDSIVRSLFSRVVPLYIIALIVAFLMAVPDFNYKGALREWVRLLHIYSGIITLGGGIFLSLVFRLSDRAVSRIERGAISDIARTIFGSWRVAAIAQLVTGGILATFYQTGITGWLVQSIILYVFALYMWWIGFGHALRAAKHDSLYEVGDHISEFRKLRDNRLTIAILLTAWVLITMIYKDHANVESVATRIYNLLTDSHQR